MNGEDSLPIAEIERRTGVAKDTLRIWERRYGFPAPRREGVQRAYSAADVEPLLLIRRLVEQGHRPAQVVGQPLERLKALVAGPAAPAPDPVVGDILSLLHEHAADALRARLASELARHGLSHFVQDIAAPLSIAVGQAWSEGRLAIFEEHLFTEQLTRVLRGALDALPPHGAATPRMLLTTLPGEPHTLGLLMAEAMFSLGGARCLSLGPETPESDIAHAALAHGAQIVAVSFSSFSPPQRARRGLQVLRGALERSIDLWAGGEAISRRAPRAAGLRTFTGLHEIEPALVEWRARQG